MYERMDTYVCWANSKVTFTKMFEILTSSTGRYIFCFNSLWCYIVKKRKSTVCIHPLTFTLCCFASAIIVLTFLFLFWYQRTIKKYRYNGWNTTQKTGKNIKTLNFGRNKALYNTKLKMLLKQLLKLYELFNSLYNFEKKKKLD